MSLKSLLGYLSGTSKEVRTLIGGGPEKLFKFLYKHPETFNVVNVDEIRLRMDKKYLRAPDVKEMPLSKVAKIEPANVGNADYEEPESVSGEPHLEDRPTLVNSSPELTVEWQEALDFLKRVTKLCGGVVSVQFLVGYMSIASKSVRALFGGSRDSVLQFLTLHPDVFTVVSQDEIILNAVEQMVEKPSHSELKAAEETDETPEIPEKMMAENLEPGDHQFEEPLKASNVINLDTLENKAVLFVKDAIQKENGSSTEIIQRLKCASGNIQRFTGSSRKMLILFCMKHSEIFDIISLQEIKLREVVCPIPGTWILEKEAVLFVKEFIVVNQGRITLDSLHVHIRKSKYGIQKFIGCAKTLVLTFLTSHSDVFNTISNDNIQLAVLDNSGPCEVTKEETERNSTVSEQSRVANLFIDLAKQNSQRAKKYETKAINYFTNCLQKGKGQASLQVLLSSMSQMKSNVKQCVGTTSENLLNFLKEHGNVFRVQNDDIVELISAKQEVCSPKCEGMTKIETKLAKVLFGFLQSGRMPLTALCVSFLNHRNHAGLMSVARNASDLLSFIESHPKTFAIREDGCIEINKDETSSNGDNASVSWKYGEIIAFDNDLIRIITTEGTLIYFPVRIQNSQKFVVGDAVKIFLNGPCRYFASDVKKIDN